MDANSWIQTPHWIASGGACLLLIQGMFFRSRILSYVLFSLIALSFCSFNAPWILLGAAAFFVASFACFSEEPKGAQNFNDLLALMLASICALGLLLSAPNLFYFYLALEGYSLLTAGVLGFSFQNKKAGESALMYMMISLTASALLLWSLSMLWAQSGSLDWAALAGLKPIWGFCLLAGVLMKWGLVPFHFWAPDIWNHSPAPISAWLINVSKVALFAGTLKVVEFLGFAGSSHGVLSVFAISTLIVGSFAALGAKEPKKIFVYGSLASSGFLSLLLLVPQAEAKVAGFAYLGATIPANILTFWLLKSAPKNAQNTAILGLSLFSLVGIPPLAGFAAKLGIFMLLMQKGFLIELAVAFLASLLAVAYSIKLLRIWNGGTTHKPRISFYFFLLLSAPIIILGVYWETLLEILKR